MASFESRDFSSLQEAQDTKGGTGDNANNEGAKAQRGELKAEAIADAKCEGE